MESVPGTVQRRESFDPGILKRALWIEPGAERQNWPQDSASQTVTGRG